MSLMSWRRQGFSLVEVTLALGVAAFCLLAILGLLPVGLTSNRNAIEQTAAAGIATGIFADLRATPFTSGSNGTSPRYKIPVPATGTATHNLFLREDGSAAGTLATDALDKDAVPAQNPRYRVTIVFTVPPAKTSYFGVNSPTATQGKATIARVMLTWPAVADGKTASAPVNYSGSFESLSALERY